MVVSFFPATMDDPMAEADANVAMPPESTWIKPKLAAGIV